MKKGSEAIRSRRIDLSESSPGREVGLKLRFTGLSSKKQEKTLEQKYLTQTRKKTNLLEPLARFGLLNLALLALGLLLIAGQTGVSSVAAVIPSVETNDPMPQLDGEKATEYLKHQGLFPSLEEAMEASRYSINPTKNAPLQDQKGVLKAKNPNQGFTTYFASDGAHLVSNASNDKWRIRMELKGFGYGKDIIPVEQTEMNVNKDKSRIEITKSEITEWYHNSALGLEQGWTISEKPSNSTDSDELRLAMNLDGDLQAKIAADGLSLRFIDELGKTVLNYDKLKSWDADGKEIASRMELSDNELSIVVKDSDAKYPITIDPLVTQTESAKLTASDGAASDLFGGTVAISGDTAIVGASGDDDAGASSGSAYVYVRSGTGWVQQQKLTASDAAEFDQFGISVAISGDTVIVGAVGGTGNEAGSGSAYVFVRSSLNFTWTQQSKLTASDGLVADRFGESVAISGDTAIVGARRGDGNVANTGSAYVYVRSGTTWAEQSELTASDGAALDDFGLSVAISANTAVVAARSDDDAGASSGSAYVYVRSGASWTQQQKLTALDAESGDFFGRSVAISGDTVIIGATFDDDNGTDSGAAYVYFRSGTSWTQQQKLTASDGELNDWFGYTVAISGDTAIVMGIRGIGVDVDAGSGYVFERSGTTWTEQSKLIASDGAAGKSYGIVAMSGDAAIVGSTFGDGNELSSGSAYIFTVPITLNKATPGVMYASTGIADGGRLLTIDLGTGAGSLVGATDRPNVADIAINSGGDIFAVQTSNNTPLYRLDAATGIAKFVASTGASGVESLTFDENGVLYGSGQFSGQKLFIIDQVTGATTEVGPTEPDIVGLAFDPTDGTLYASQGRGSDNIYIINKTTGAATLVGQTGLGGSTPSIAFDAAGNLYGVKGGGQGANKLISINKATGQGTVIGPIGFTSVSGLSFAVPPNAAPTANAGLDQSIRAGDIVDLDGSASFDDNTASGSLVYSWSFTSVPAGSTATLTGANTATPSFVADLNGDYVVELEVTDEGGLKGTDEVGISSNNLAPTAAAGDDKLVIVGNLVSLDGSGSSDPEMDAISYSWNLVVPLGSLATLTDPTTATPYFVPDVEGTYVVTLVPSDFIGPGLSDTVEITATSANGFAENRMVAACAIVESLTPGQVTAKGNQNALCNFIGQAVSALQKSPPHTETAIDKVKKAIERVDGCALRGSPDGNGAGMDWITDCATQAEVYRLLNEALSALTTP